MNKTKRRNYVVSTELNGQKTESDDMSQYQVVSHGPSSDLDNLCNNIKNNANLLRFTHVEFDKLGKLDMNEVEESIYKMMATFKTMDIEIYNSLPKSLFDQVEKKWQYSLTTKKQIKEPTLARVMLDLDKSMMKKAINKYKGKFSPKYKAFNILQNYIEEVIK